MNYKKILLGISLFGLTGIANFCSNKASIPYKTPAPATYFIENNNLKINIDKEGGILHSIQLKKFQNAYSNTNHVVLNSPQNYKSCIETGYQGDEFPNRLSTWSLIEQKPNYIILKSKGTKYSIIRTIKLKEESFTIKDNIEGYEGLAQHYTCINGNGTNKGKFIVKTKDNQKFFDNENYSSIFLFWKKYVINKTEINIKNDTFAFLTDDHFMVAIQPKSDNGLINYYSDKHDVKLFNISTVQNKHEIEIFVLPNSMKDLAKYDLDGLRYYRWPSFISKFLSFETELLITKMNIKFLGFLLSVIFFALLMSPLIYWQKKRSRDAELMQLKQMREMGTNFSPQAMFLSSIKYMLVTMIIAFISNFLIFYYFLNLTLGESFYLKSCQFLWIKDLSLHDTGSIFNLYGLLPYETPSMVRYFGAIQLWFLVVLYYFQSKDMQQADNKKMQKKPNKILLFSLCLLFLRMYTSVAQMMGFCIFQISKEGVLYIINKSMKKGNIDYRQI